MDAKSKKVPQKQVAISVYLDDNKKINKINQFVHHQFYNSKKLHKIIFKRNVYFFKKI